MNKCEICGVLLDDGYLANDLAKILDREPEHDEENFFICPDCLRNINDALDEAWQRKGIAECDVEPCSCGAPTSALNMRVSVITGWNVECSRCGAKGPATVSSESAAVKLWNDCRKEHDNAMR